MCRVSTTLRSLRPLPLPHAWQGTSSGPGPTCMRTHPTPPQLFSDSAYPTLPPRTLHWGTKHPASQILRPIMGPHIRGALETEASHTSPFQILTAKSRSAGQS